MISLFFLGISDAHQVKYINLQCVFDMERAKIIGKNLEQARKDKGMKQADVAKRFGMTQQQYSRLENGELRTDFVFLRII